MRNRGPRLFDPRLLEAGRKGCPCYHRQLLCRRCLFPVYNGKRTRSIAYIFRLARACCFAIKAIARLFLIESINLPQQPLNLLDCPFRSDDHGPASSQEAINPPAGSDRRRCHVWCIGIATNNRITEG